MGIKRFKDIIDAYETGNVHYTSYRKVPSQVTTARTWFDLSQSPWNPNPQYFASTPLVGTPMYRSVQWGINHWTDHPTKTKYLAKTTLIASSVNAQWQYILCDYLYYYPFIDEGDTEEQPLDNSNPMTRYTDWAGVQMMALTVAARNGGTRFQVKYTNQDWVEWRLSQIMVKTSVQAIWTIAHTFGTAVWNGNQTSAFIGLQEWDTGVRKIESVTMLDSDVWLLTFVLVKPIVNTCFVWIDAPVEVEYVRDTALQLPEIKPDAFLSYLCSPWNSLSGVTIMWDFTFIKN